MNIIVRLMPLPPSIKGVTIPDQNGNYNIYLNQTLAYEMQLETYHHERTHIEKNDFQEDKPVAVLESRAGGVSRKNE